MTFRLLTGYISEQNETEMDLYILTRMHIPVVY